MMNKLIIMTILGSIVLTMAGCCCKEDEMQYIGKDQNGWYGYSYKNMSGCRDTVYFPPLGHTIYLGVLFIAFLIDIRMFLGVAVLGIVVALSAQSYGHEIKLWYGTVIFGPIFVGGFATLVVGIRTRD
jgi:hypothetical protein